MAGIGLEKVLGAVAGEALRQVVPGGQLITDAFHHLCSASDDSVQRARLEAIEDEVVRLRAAVERLETRLAADGTELERPDLIAVENEVSEFVRAITAAPSREKREALVNAAACQHDPRLGPVASRRYWWGVVRDLSDIEVQVLATIGDGAMGFGWNDKVFLGRTLRFVGGGGDRDFVEDDGTSIAPSEHPAEYVVALELTARAMLSKDPVLLEGSGDVYRLLSSGRIALRYVRGE